MTPRKEEHHQATANYKFTEHAIKHIYDEHCKKIITNYLSEVGLVTSIPK